MALIDKASLLMVPSTYEAGKLYNVLPSGNRAPDNKGGAGYDQTRADFDFDRGTDHGATRIGSDGLLKKYRENVLTYSNSFNQWSVVSVSLTGGQTGYDGSNDAWLFNSSAGYIRNNLSLSGVYTYSIYAKQGTADGIRLRMDAGTDANVYISLTDGSESFSPSGIDYTATNVGDGWWRISVTQNDSSFSNFRVYAIDASGGSTTGTIYIQDAQVERSLVPTGYLETTTTTTGKAGVLVDLPRINYDANGENGSLLLEPSRANLLPHSEYFNGGFSGSFETNAAISPDGTMNASKFVFTQGASYPQFYTFLSGLVVGQQYTSSIYIKKTEASEDFQMISSGVSFIPTDEWQRVVRSFTATSTSQSVLVNYVPSVGVGVINEVYVAFAQVEAGSYATSYIPNHGESGGVTRAADFGIANDVDTNQSEGTLFVDFDIDANAGGTYDCIIGLGDGSSANRFGILRNDDNTIRVYMVTAGASQVEFDTTQSSGRLKIGFAYKANDAAIYVNGTQELTDSSFSVSPNTKVAFNQYLHVLNSNTYTTQASIRQTALFKERLTNEELATLTTL